MEAELTALQQERASLTAQLRSLRYATELTAAELARRTAPGPPSPRSPPSEPPAPPDQSPPPSPRVLEADLLAAKAASTAARQRVHALEAEAASLRRLRGRSEPAARLAAAEPRQTARRAVGSLSPVRRGASRRAIAQFDALVADASASGGGGSRCGVDGGGGLVPCLVSVSAACAVSVAAEGHSGREARGKEESSGPSPAAGEPLLVLEPPFARVSEVESLETEVVAGGDEDGGDSGAREKEVPAGFGDWMTSLAVRVWPPTSAGKAEQRDPVSMLLCGVHSAVMDAQSLVLQHNASPFGTPFGSTHSGHEPEGLNSAPSGTRKGSTTSQKPGSREGLLAQSKDRVAAVAAESASAAKSIAAGISSRLSAFSLGGLGESLADAPDAQTAGTTLNHASSESGNREKPARAQRRGMQRSVSVDVPKAARMVGGSSAILSPSLTSALMSAVPSRFTSCSLRLLYSTRVHGISLQSLYAKCAGHSPTIVAFLDSGGARFGCFATASWAKSAKQTYYGTGESFCWRVESSANDGIVSKDNPTVYKWSKANNYFQFSSPSYLAVGGGGHFALRIDDDLQKGTSGDCATYGSPCLASTTDFDCVVLEAWAVETTSRWR